MNSFKDIQHIEQYPLSTANRRDLQEPTLTTKKTRTYLSVHKRCTFSCFQLVSIQTNSKAAILNLATLARNYNEGF